MEVADGQSLQVDYAIPVTNTTVTMWFKTTKGGGLIFSSLGNGSDKDLHIGRKDNSIGGAVESFIWQGKVSFINSGATDYRDGKWHHVARTVGPGGHNLYLDGVRVIGAIESSVLNYHLGEMVEVEPKLQVMRFEHKPAHPGSPLQSLTFRCKHPETDLYLLALTLRQSGPRIHAITYNGRQVAAYPPDAPRAKPSVLDGLRDTPRRMSLDGQWQFRTDPGNQGMRKKWYAVDHNADDWQPMPVPSQWYVEGVNYHGVGWYRRDFTVPKHFTSPVYELNFDRVDYDTRVWVNGDYAGRHVGAFSAFKLDVSQWIRKGKRNTVVVRVDSPIDPGYSGGHKSIIKGNSMDDIPMPYGEEGCMGGIYRSVELTRRGKLGIENAWTHCKISQDLKQAVVTVNFELNPSRTFKQKVNIRCRLTEPGDGGCAFKINKKISINEMERIPVELKLTIDHPMLWTVWEQGDPHLHLLEIKASVNDHLLDKHISRVGIREFGEVHKEYYTLNHHRIFIKGMLNDDIHWQSMMDRTGYQQRIQLQKNANLNLIRLIGHQSSPDFYDLCDEMGMLVWQEMPLQWVYSSSEPVRKNILDIAEETIVQTRPHACVMGYTGWNEGGQMGFTEKLMKRIRSLDPTRPVWAASGGTGWGDKEGWNIHIYPNLSFNLSRTTPFWFGINSGFISEVGAYGLSSLEEMHDIMGEELFPFDSASFYWDNFSSYRWSDSMIFMDQDGAAAEKWSTDRMRDYTLSKVDESERWLVNFMKSTYENFRGQRFNKSSGVIHCRFDDAFPTAFLGVVNFNGRPRKAYYGVQQACQQVLAIMAFDCIGVEDIRVINEYWEKSWENCTLTYQLKNRQGEIVIDKEKQFDLGADATVKVLSRDEAGDVWMMDGFSAELSVKDSSGKVLSANSYDFTPQEVRDFITTVYPVPPYAPVDAQMVLATETKSRSGASEIPTDGKRPISGPYHAMASTLAEEFYEPIGTYGEALVKLEGEKPHLTYSVEVKEAGDYTIRMSCDSGKIMRDYELRVDGQKATLEEYPYIDITRGLTRVAYYGQSKSSGDYDLTGSGNGLSWRPGWKAHLTQGTHTLEFIWPQDQAAPALLIDALCLQKSNRYDLSESERKALYYPKEAVANGTLPITEKFTWPEGKRAAVSLTYDDAYTDQTDNVIPLLDQYGFKGTFYILEVNYVKRLAAWKKAAMNGHEIGNHSASHTCTINYELGSLEDWTLDDVARDIDKAQQYIYDNFGIKAVTFAYPCGQKYVGRGKNAKSYIAVVAERFLVGRGYLEEAPARPGYCDLANVNGIKIDSLPFEKLKEKVDQAAEHGCWLIFGGHGIDRKNTPSHESLNQLCQYLADPANGIWVDTVENIGRYIYRQRMAVLRS